MLDKFASNEEKPSDKWDVAEMRIYKNSQKEATEGLETHNEGKRLGEFNTHMVHQRQEKQRKAAKKLNLCK